MRKIKCTFFVIIIFIFAVLSCDKKNKNKENSNHPYDIVNMCNSYIELKDGDSLHFSQTCVKITQNATIRLIGLIEFDNNHILQIEKGATILAATSIDSGIALRPGAKILAYGTRKHPITFTSDQPVGNKQPGDWGGIKIHGKAKGFTEGFPEGCGKRSINRNFRANDSDNSGILQYVRILFAGKEVVYDGSDPYCDAINLSGHGGLNLNNVGSQTVIEHIQLHNNYWDGIAIRGGTVNLKYIVSTLNVDDAFHASFGWRGKAQFLALASAESTNTKSPLGSCNHAIEMYHSHVDSYLDLQTSGSLYNVTALTGNNCKSIRLRAGVSVEFKNLYSAFSNNSDKAPCIYTESSLTELQLDNSLLENCINPGYNTINESNVISGLDVQVNEGIPEYINSLLYSSRDDLLFNGSKIFEPKILQQGLTPPNDGFLDTSANHIGAIGEENWITDWTIFPGN